MSTATRWPALADAGLELFIYYRIQQSAAAEAAAVVREFQQRLCAAHAGLTARWLRRPEPDQALQTWMEIYRFEARAQGSGICAALQSEIEAAAKPLARLITGVRHLEVFVPCA